jgi:hypothetical protein
LRIEQGVDMSRTIPVALLCALCVLVMLGTVAAQPAPPAMVTVLPEVITAPQGITPAILAQSSDLARESYRAALKHPDVLASVPCTCGCMEADTLAHRNNLDCYIDGTHPDGSVTFTTHGLGCGICQLITRDAVEGAAAGMSVEELQAMVMERYGPKTHKP